MKSLLCIGESVIKAPEHEVHLNAESSSFIIGGHQGSVTVNQQPSDQIPHKDIPGVVIEDAEYSSSSNPHLRGKVKPFTIHIPLDDCRTIYVYDGGEKKIVTTYYREGLILAGDVTHGGVTLPQFTGWHPGFHLYFTSIFHEANLHDFEIDTQAVVESFPHLLPRLTDDAQKSALSEVNDVQHAAYKAALYSEDTSDSSVVEQSLRDHIERLSLLLPDEGTPKKAKKSDEVIDVDINSPQRVYAANPTQFLTLHNTFPEGVSMIETRFGPIIKMSACGSCGYWAAIEFLISENKVQRGITIKEFRKQIHDYGIENVSRFAGRKMDGSDACFKSSNGDHGFFNSFRVSRNAVTTRTRAFLNSTMLNIYRPNKTYRSCTIEHYMDGGNVLPIISPTLSLNHPLG